MKFIKLLSIIVFPFSLFAQNNLEIGREFGLFTSENLSGYIKPLTTTISQSLNSSLFTNSRLGRGFSLSFDLSFSGMLIPISQKSFEAELPTLFGDTTVVLNAQSKNNKIIYNPSGHILEPTLFGGKSIPVFAAPQHAYPPDSMYKSVAFAEGNNISIMSGLPVLQLIAGFPTRTEVRLRYFSFPVLNSPITYYTVALNQNLDQFFKIFGDNSPISFGIFSAYHSIHRNPGIDISSFAIGSVFSYNTYYGVSYSVGMQYEDLSGEVMAIRSSQGNSDIVNSPYEEVREGDPLKINFGTFTKFKLECGISYIYKFLELHAEAAFASQPMISAGIKLKIFDTEKAKDIFEPIDIPEMIPQEPVLAALPDIYQNFETAILQKEIFPFKNEFQIFSKDGTEEIKKITIETYHSKQFRPFLPYIFFDENRSEISSKYIKISSEEAPEFNFSKFKGMNSVETYYSFLNILGYRLSENPLAKITLIGCNSNTGQEKNNKKLSKSRAESVKNYLVGIWKINPKRIQVSARNLPKKASSQNDPEGIEENRRVEIESNSLDIIAPIIIQDTLRYIKPDGILLKNDVSSQNLIKNWKLNINSDNKSIINFFGTSSINKFFQINLTDNKTLLNNPGNSFNVKVTLENQENIISESDKHIPIDIVTKDSSINIYNMILFDFNKSNINNQNMKITNFINSDLKQNAEVKVLGYTDRIGNSDYNKKLSEERAKAIGTKLKSKKVEITGIGEGEVIFDNSTPEGRFYSRTVEIQVRQETNQENKNEK